MCQADHRVTSRLVRGLHSVSRMANPHEPNVLAGVDFSPCSERALATAVELAKSLGVQLHVVHVFEPISVTNTPHDYTDIAVRIERERQRRRILCIELCERVVKDRVLYTVHIIDAMARDGLIEAIERFKPEFVVVGSHGRGAFKRMLLGSVSAALCRHSAVPIVVVPEAKTRVADAAQSANAGSTSA